MKDTMATMTGVFLGLEQLNEAFDYLAELNSQPDWKFAALIVKALVILGLGYLAYKPKGEPHAPSPTV